MSTESVANASFIIETFPNPFSGELKIKIQHAGNQTYKGCIYNILGQNVFSIESFGNNIRINPGNLASGMYILEINSGLNKVSRKIFKK